MMEEVFLARRSNNAMELEIYVAVTGVSSTSLAMHDAVFVNFFCGAAVLRAEADLAGEGAGVRTPH